MVPSPEYFGNTGDGAFLKCLNEGQRKPTIKNLGNPLIAKFFLMNPSIFGILLSGWWVVK
jgi:hypothetical protein